LKNAIFITSILLLSSCTSENTLLNSFPIQLLHGNSAKVWVISKSSNPNDKDVAAVNNYRKSFIFYSNQSFREQELIHLGSQEGFIGSYTVDEDNHGEITLNLRYNNNEYSSFIIQSISNTSLSLMKLQEGHDTWEFKSLKPPKL